MITKGIIFIEPDSSRLNFLKTAKPFTLVYGKPLIVHQIQDQIDAGIKHIKIIALQDDISHLKKIILEEKDLNAEIQYFQSSFQDIYKNLGKIIAEDPADRQYVSACGLIFEKNPYANFSHRKEVEILLDKQLLHNKFSGTTIKAKTSLFGLQSLGTAIKGHNAQFTKTFFIGKKASVRFGGLLSSGLSLKDVFLALYKESSLGVSFLSKSLWYELNSPETVMRAEMLLRKKNQGSRPTKVNVDKLESLYSDLSFHYEKSQTTEVVVKKGLLDMLDKISLMKPNQTASHHIIITDEYVDKLLGEKVLLKLKSAGYVVTKLIAPTGEAAKTMDVYREFAEKIVGLGIDEHSIVFSLGGGAIANLTGFLAATLYRGIGLIHIPTTLMCMNDVAISLKQGVNSQKGKNLVGSYYQPLLVLIDPGIPMSKTVIAHGLSETIKHALAQDEFFFDLLLAYDGEIENPDFLETVIRKTIELKIELMHEDMFEHARAIVLQYGHEVGHALEHLSHFKLTHGEAISIGMRVSAEIAHLMGVTPKETVAAHKKILKHYGLPFVVPEYIERNSIVDALKFNKKTHGKDIRFALVEFVGKIWKIKGEYGIPCSPEMIEEALKRSYKE